MSDGTATQQAKQISLFIPRFFLGLGTIIAAFPIIDELLGILPNVIRYQNVLPILTTLSAFAVIGTSFLKMRKTSDEIFKALQRFIHHKKRSDGKFLLLLGVLLTLAYLGFSDWLLSQNRDTSTLEEILAIVLYVGLYTSYATGFWQMGMEAYITRYIKRT